MFRKSFVLLLLALLLLIACRATDVEEPTPEPVPTIAAVVESNEEKPAATVPTPEAAVTIGFTTFDFEQGRYNDLVAAFEEENADVKIELRSIEEILELDNVAAPWPDDARLRLASAADVSAYFYTPSASAQGLVLDLGPLMTADTQLEVSDFYPNLLSQYQAGGGTWAFPTEANYQLIFYNKDAFDQSGLAYPQSGWSWDDFLATAQALTLREGDEVSQWGFVEAFPRPTLFVQSWTGPLFDMSTDPPAFDLEAPQVVDAMSWYTNLFLTHQVSPYFEPAQELDGVLNIPEGYSLIEQGKAAMWPEFSGAWAVRRIQMNIGAVAFPVSDEADATTLVIPSGLSISAGTKHPEAAWRWIKFLSLQASEMGFSLGGNPTSLPARRSAAVASHFWEEADEELAQALSFAIEHTYPAYEMPDGFDGLDEAFAAIVSESESVAGALADAQLAAENRVADNLSAPAETTPVPAIVVAEPETETAANPDAVPVQFMAGANPLEIQAFRDLAKQYLEINPAVIVNITQPDILSGAPGLSDMAADADCFQWYPGAFNDPANLAALLSMDPFFDADPSIRQEEFFPTVLSPFVAQGQIWGLPAQVNIGLIEYNQDLFDAAGVAYPTSDWTTDDFLDIAVAMTQGEGAARQYGYVPELLEPTDFINFLDRLGATLVDDSVDPPALAYNTPAVTDAMRWYTSLTTEYAVKPTLMTNITGASAAAVQEWQTILVTGRAAMWSKSALISGMGLAATQDYQSGIVPLPKGSGHSQGSGYLNVSGYFISASSESRQECWQWLNFLTQQPNIGQGLPARISVAQSEAYRQHVGAETAAAYLASMEGVTQPPFSLQFTDKHSWIGFAIIWLYQSYDDIIANGLSIEEALDDAQAMADAYRACIIAEDVASDEAGQQACAQRTDPSLPAIFFGASD